MPERILVVDDDRDLAEVVQLALETHGYATRVASNGQEALVAVENEMPSLIILDMLMPIMNGWEFAKEFFATFGRAAPIVVLTAAEDARSRAAEIGADATLSKPFATRALLATVRRLLEHGEDTARPAADRRAR